MEKGRVVNLAQKDPTTSIRPEAPIQQRTDPWDEMELPPLMGNKARADLLARELHNLRSDSPIVDMEAVKDLSIPRPKQEGVTVQCDQESREIVVSYKGWIVCIVTWIVNGSQFRIKRRVEVAVGCKQTHEYFSGFKEAWRVLMEYGVTPQEYQQAFVDLPPQVEWHFDKCPEGRTDCQLNMTFKRDPRDTDEMPGYYCRRCGSEFQSVEFEKDRYDVRLVNRGTLLSSVEGPIVTERPSGLDRPIGDGAPRSSTLEIPFEKDILRYQGMGRTRLEALKANGIDSWEKLAVKEPEEVSLIRGFSGRSALLLIEIAREKTGKGGFHA